MKPDAKNQNGWQADLNDFFADIEREDRVFAKNVERKTRFYAEVARPALDAVKQQLARHGRECETGLDHDRVYLIVRKGGGAVEFQYAVVAEARIETVTPFAHCWFETALPDENQAADENEQPEEDDDENGNEDDENKDEAGDDDKDDNKNEKQNDKPQRTKTIELLTGWDDRREIETVSQNEVIADFLLHYKEAVNRLRAPLHAAES